MAVVIGCGNPLRGDDGVGAVVADRVGRAIPDVHVVTRHQLVPELADTIASANLVVFVDAAIGGTPGELCSNPVLHSDVEHARIDHAMSPEALLRLTRETYGIEPTAWLVRVNASDFAFGRTLSAPVAAAVPRAVEVVRSIVERAVNHSNVTADLLGSPT